MPRCDSAESADAFCRYNESTRFSKSVDAIVDRDSDHDHGDGDDRHPDQDGPDASEAVVNDGAYHEPNFRGNVATSQPPVRHPFGYA
jgi:hypothetical protein